MTTQLTFEDVIASMIPKAAYICFKRYRRFQLPAEDFRSEMYVWVYGDGNAKVLRYLDNGQNFRLYRSLVDKGCEWGEREKAHTVGYSVDDVFWFTPRMVEGLMPLVLDDTFTQEDYRLGELATAVVDIRRVLRPADRLFFLENDNDSPLWGDAVARVINALGGRSPFQRRRVMSNAQAQAITRDTVDG